MFEIFKRVKTILNSEFNNMLDKAEDPVKMVEQYLRDMSSDISEVEKSVASQIANEKLLDKKVLDLKEKVNKREEQAMLALQNDQEDLAKKALEDKLNLNNELVQLQELLEVAKQNSIELKANLSEMKKQYREMELKKETLKSRANSAKAIKKANKTLSSIDGNSAKKGFERMEEKVMQFEAEAETSKDLSKETFSLDKKFQELENNNSVEVELARLKEKLNSDKKD